MERERYREYPVYLPGWRGSPPEKGKDLPPIGEDKRVDPLWARSGRVLS